MTRLLILCLALVTLTSQAVQETTPTPEAPEARAEDDVTSDEPPEGYYAFVESPNATPPRVRPPPYRQVATDCPEVGEKRPRVSAHNLCGDLNRGTIPRNPMGQNPNGEPYPFEVIRNQTLRFLSRTLPVLRADDTLPRVAALPPARETHDLHSNHLDDRGKRSLPAEEAGAEHRAADAPRDSRKFCDGGGVFCMLYRAFNGDSEPSPAPGGVERREDPGSRPPHLHRYEGPPTPCPARVEYATPVFARNYQGVWRYVVQIPYEGYFTQTVEVTRCMQSRCHYLEGGCLSSPRWVSLLVAELHYPAAAPHAQDYQQYLQKRAGLPTDAEPASEKPPHCDGHDELGCYQVRLYYDWFLVPGSCKCWRPDYFAKYVRRAHNADL
ncbi:uncharacterized protein LOC106140903 [Amyelois transitella]|uniref:uncharacterized protein LOC106140903 n=1 Tax=Amyelois transitella TaxID=680683 RepID=UPI0029906DF7|nr:uncharacterized protein LOC106140903 [Amyelois transitella]